MDSLIQAAIPALLNDPDAKAALLDYIKTLTDKERPKEEWREVWWQLSDDVRRHKDASRVTLEKNPKIRLYVRVMYSQTQVGVILASFVSEYADPRNRWDRLGDGFLIGEWHREVVNAENYVDAITAAQKAWSTIHEKWVAETLPLEVK